MDCWARRPCSRAYHTNLTYEQDNSGRTAGQPYNCTNKNPPPTVNGSLITAVVLPPDSEVVANFSIDGGQLGTCALVNPNRDLTEDFGVIVGHTLVDATTPSANVLIINPNAEEVVLPCGAHIGDLVPVFGCVGGPVGFTKDQ